MTSPQPYEWVIGAQILHILWIREQRELRLSQGSVTTLEAAPRNLLPPVRASLLKSHNLTTLYHHDEGQVCWGVGGISQPSPEMNL